MHEGQPHLSLRRVLLVILPVAIVGLGAYLWSATLEPAARNELSNNVFARMLSANVSGGGSTMNYPDKDKDFIADSPEDPAKCIDPEVLVFSFIAAETESVPKEAWDKLTAALKEKTGREVKYVHYESVNEQLKALKDGELHIAGLNTGIVPTAVQQSGFVPLCTFGREDNSYGYTMKLIVPADSKIKEAKDVKGHKVMFTRPDSNSGCKALVMYLKDQEDLQPDRDYAWGFSSAHETSIKGVADKEFEAAPVASDVFTRMVEGGEVDGNAVRAVYESERFPPATLGYVYNLTPELRTAIRETMLGFELAATGLEGQFGADATKLVPIDYKNDWANARRIDQLVAQARTQR
jgi:phosphonate transport system substrate-binding protein